MLWPPNKHGSPPAPLLRVTLEFECEDNGVAPTKIKVDSLKARAQRLGMRLVDWRAEQAPLMIPLAMAEDGTPVMPPDTAA